MRTRRRQPAGPRGNGTHPDGAGEEGSPAELEALVRNLRSDLRVGYDSLKRTAAVEWQRFRWKANDAWFRAGLVAFALAFGLTASISAAILIVLGIREALAAWSRAVWVGDLGAGFLIAGAAIGGALAVRRHIRKDCLSKAREALAERTPVGSEEP